MSAEFSATTAAVAAFAHHIAAFTLVAALAVELVLLRIPLTLASARRIQRADLAYGIAAGAVLAVGFFRVFYFDKGPEYYFHSAPFIAKVTVFALVALVSIYPTIEFISWGKVLKAGNTPQVPERKMRAMKSVIHWEIAGLLIVTLCAALMARGVGVIS